MNKTMSPFKIALEEVIVGFLQETGAMDLQGDDIMENAKSLGYQIVRKKVKRKEEFATLLKHGVIMKTVYISQSGGKIHRIEMDKEQMIQLLKERGL